jgi:hypothetical protein
MADDDPVASSDGVFSNTCEYDDSAWAHAWADNAEGRDDRENNHWGYDDDGFTVLPPISTSQCRIEPENHPLMAPLWLGVQL